MSVLETHPDDTFANDRAHVFHSWSAQGLIDPARRRRRRGLVVLGRRRQALPRLLQPARQRQHRPPAPEARRRDPGAGRQAVHGRPGHRQRRPQRGRPADRRAGPGRPRHGVLHQRRRRGQRERDAHGAPAHRPHKVLATYRSYHGATGGSIAITGDPRRWPSEAGVSGHRPLLGAVPVPLRRSTPPTEAEESERALAHLARHADGRGPAVRSPRSSSSRWSAPTASSCRRPATSQGVRDLCDEFGIVMIADEVMAGFGRCGEWFSVDHWDVTPDLITLRQGRQLRLRAARRRDHLPAHRRHVPRRASTPAASPTRAIRSPVRRRSRRSTSSRRRASSSTPAPRRPT